MYAAAAIDVPNSRGRITARMGAGPPAVTEASRNPSADPLYLSDPGKLSTTADGRYATPPPIVADASAPSDRASH